MLEEESIVWWRNSGVRAGGVHACVSDVFNGFTRSGADRQDKVPS